MPPYPADGRVVAADSVGQGFVAQLRRVDKQLVDAAKRLEENRDLYEFENALRAARGDRPVSPGDLHMVSTPNAPS